MRLYIDKDMARFTRRDLTLVDMELYDGRRFENLEPRRLFPLSGTQKYITLLDSEGIERAIIRDLSTLPEADGKIIADCLNEYYLIPKITAISAVSEKYGVVRIFATTGCGDAVIEIRNVIHGIKFLYGRRVLFTDTSDNRFEISDITALDKTGRMLIDSYL